MTEDGAQAPQAEIAGFWRRVCAFAVDGAIVSAIGLVAGYIFFEPLVRLGTWGRLLGLPVEIAYFGMLNSSLAGGRTPGKRLMRIKVVDGAGEALVPKRAVARAAILALPFTLNGVQVPPHAPLATPLKLLAEFIFVGGTGSILYLFFANRRTRQSLHDLLVGSFVVRAESSGPIYARPWRGHFAVVGLGCAAIAGLGLWVAAPSEGRLAAFQKAHRTMEDLPLVQSAGVFAGTVRYLDSDETRYVKVYIRLSHDPADREAVAAGFAREIVSAFPEAADADQVIIVLSYGYDLGIAHWSHTTTHAWTPATIPRAGPTT